MTSFIRTASFLALSFIIFIFTGTIFQGCKGAARSQHKSNVSSDKLQLLKSRTTVFIVPVKEYANIEDYKSVLSQVWTLTPFEVIKYNEMTRYADNAQRYAFFIIGGIQKSTTDYSNIHYYLTLGLPYETTRKGKTKSYELCRVELYPDMKTVNSFSTKNFADNIYMNGEFRNFTLPYMTAYLRFVQKNLQNGKDPWVYDNYTDEAMRTKLRRDTLYVPQGLMYSRNKFTGKEDEREENFFASYEGPYKYVSNEELTTLLKNRKASKPLFLFEYVLSSTDKYVGVLEVNSGTVVYRRYTPVTYNIKPKDLKAILN